MTKEDHLLDQAHSGSHSAIGQLITALEAGNSAVLSALGARLQLDTQPTPRLGITGAPGVGKSSLVAAMTRSGGHGHTIGVLAVDPSSEETGGAILGDRYRLYTSKVRRSAEDTPYFRSMGSRGSQNAISRHLGVTLALMEYAGMQPIFVETAGAGQSDIAIRDWVDCLVLVLSPDSGDIIQMLKSGLMEWADVFVVNKSDRPGASVFAAQLRAVTGLGRMRPASVHLVEATGAPEALADLKAEIERVAVGRFKDRALMWRAAMAGFMEAALVREIKVSLLGEASWLAALDQCVVGKLSVQQAVRSAWESVFLELDPTPAGHEFRDQEVDRF